MSRHRAPEASGGDQTASETVRAAILESGLPIRELSRRTGVEPAVLSRFINEQVGISLSTFEKLANELGLRVVRSRRRSRQSSEVRDLKRGTS